VQSFIQLGAGLRLLLQNVEGAFCEHSAVTCKPVYVVTVATITTGYIVIVFILVYFRHFDKPVPRRRETMSIRVACEVVPLVNHLYVGSLMPRSCFIATTMFMSLSSCTSLAVIARVQSVQLMNVCHGTSAGRPATDVWTWICVLAIGIWNTKAQLSLGKTCYSLYSSYCSTDLQGYSRSMIFILSEIAYATFYYRLIVTLVLPFTVSETRPLIAWKFLLNIAAKPCR